MQIAQSTEWTVIKKNLCRKGKEYGRRIKRIIWRKHIICLLYTSMLFADETEKFLADRVNEQLAIVTIGVDYGAGKSKIKFVASGITYKFRNVYILDEMDLTGIYDPEQIYEKFIEFYKRVYEQYDKCQYAFCDYGRCV